MSITTLQKKRYSLKKRRTAALAAAVVAYKKNSANYDKQAKNTSQMTGQEWVDELLAGHPKWFYNNMGMNKHVFKALLQELIQVGLHDTRYVSSEEQLAYFYISLSLASTQCYRLGRFQCGLTLSQSESYFCMLVSTADWTPGQFMSY